MKTFLENKFKIRAKYSLIYDTPFGTVEFRPADVSGFKYRAHINGKETDYGCVTREDANGGTAVLILWTDEAKKAGLNPEDYVREKVDEIKAEGPLKTNDPEIKNGPLSDYMVLYRFSSKNWHILNAYRETCKTNNIPYAAIIYRAKYADVEIDLSTANRRLTQKEKVNIEVMFEKYIPRWVAQNPRTRAARSYFKISSITRFRMVPNKIADQFMQELMLQYRSNVR